MSTLHERLLTQLGWFDEALADPGGLINDASDLTAALRAVVELHAPFQRSTLSLGCRACSTPVHTLPGRYVTVVNWPCSTIQAIARELGVSA